MKFVIIFYSHIDPKKSEISLNTLKVHSIKTLFKQVYKKIIKQIHMNRAVSSKSSEETQSLYMKNESLIGLI